SCMEGNWAASVMDMLDKFIKLIYLNILWILFFIVGIGIFGFMPATASVTSILRKWMNKEELPSLTKEFWKQYKEGFITSNIIGLVFLVIGYILYLDVSILIGTESTIGKILLSLTFMLIYIYFVILLNFFPLYSRLEMSIANYLKLSLTIGMSHPLTTLLMILWLIIVGILCFSYTVLLPLFSVVLLCFGLILFSVV